MEGAYNNTSGKCVIVMIIATASRPAATSAAARWKIEYRSQFAQKCEWDSGRNGNGNRNRGTSR